MAEKKNFEKELKSLEAAVEKLEKGDLPLEESLRYFEDGVKSAKECRRLLDSVRTRVEILLRDSRGGLKVETSESGDIDTEPGSEE